MTLFESYSFASAPARADADQEPVSLPTRGPLTPARETGRRLYSLVGVVGLLTYGFGLPAAIWAWLG